MGKILHRVSLQDVATTAGVHISTASLALRDDPRLKPETKERVAEAARQLGYAPNPMVSAWLQQVRNPQAARPGAGIAFLIGLAADERFKKEPYYRTFLEGAREEAQALGYVVTEALFGRNGDVQLMKTISRLRYCGVRGVLVFDPAQCLSASVAAELEKGFAVVVMLRSGGTNRFHRITSDTGFNVLLALRELRAKGYERIAFPFSAKDTGPLRREAIAPFLLEQQMTEPKNRIPLPNSVIEFTPDLVRRYIEKHRPDAILGVNLQLKDYLAGARSRSTRNTLYVHLGVDCLPEIPGVVNRGIEIGRASVFKLASLLNSNRCFVPEIPALTLVPGFWRDAATSNPPEKNAGRSRVAEPLVL